MKYSARSGSIRKIEEKANITIQFNGSLLPIENVAIWGKQSFKCSRYLKYHINVHLVYSECGKMFVEMVVNGRYKKILKVQ